ncbi:hypothetical protein L211DRAFT_774920, partial [Terfezia boudieri ATCC MYA-4762]
ERVIAIYHASISDLLKKYTNEDVANDKCRILCASSTYGLGVDNRKVHRVIQWRLSRLGSLEDLVQRWGRCAREDSIQGLCLLFVEETYV